MELMKISLCLAFFLLAVSQCSEARHSMKRRETDDVNYDDVLADEATDNEEQNDAEGNDVDEDEPVDAIIETPPKNYSAIIGQDVRLECKVSPSFGVVVQWSKDNNKYFLGTLKAVEQDLNTYGVDSERFAIAANSTDLLIRGVRPEDAGSFACTLMQFKPEVIKHQLSVLEYPKIVSFTATNGGSVMEGSSVSLTCEAVGSPPPQVVWSRDVGGVNERLQEKDGEFVGYSVYIKNIKREQSGKYYCYVFNGIGANQAEVTVNVRGKPRVHVHNTIVNSAINVEAVLQCTVHDEPGAHIRWYKDGQLIESISRQYDISTRGSHSNLTVLPTSDSDFGTFTCEAENEFGSHNRSISLVQSPVIHSLEADGSRIGVTITSRRPLHTVELQVRELGGDGEWRTFNIPVPTSSSHEYFIAYTLDELEAGKYEAVVRAENDHSWSEHSDSTLLDIVYRGNSAHSVKSVALTTTLMYLLVRTL
ncbi:protein amalgam-like isoform X2 [Danaus plexippus]|uniref:protein amalgam-like isoform X2 n=1 Tax=Danaus plexippus TaxID=13037 RepID=UPI002AB0ECF3|nr:protein amalgam-like isoform X2 [Danaus plexippus]